MVVPNEGEDGLSWLDDLKDIASSGRIDKVPPGWRTNVDWALFWGMSESQTRKLLKQAVKSGKASDRVFRIKRGSRVYPVLHWKKK